MGWLTTIIIGFVIGVLAKFLHPGRDNLGFIMTTLLGIGGSALAGFVGQKQVGITSANRRAGLLPPYLPSLSWQFIHASLKNAKTYNHNTL